jgi:hypothetical protein
MSTARETGWQPHPDHPGKFGYFDGREWSGVVRHSLPEDEPVEDPRFPTASSDSARRTGRGAQRPATPGLLIAVGCALELVGLLIALNGASNDSDPAYLAGVVVAGIGGLFLLVGAIALGVVVGLRHDRASRSR